MTINKLAMTLQTGFSLTLATLDHTILGITKTLFRCDSWEPSKPRVAGKCVPGAL